MTRRTLLAALAAAPVAVAVAPQTVALPVDYAARLTAANGAMRASAATSGISMRFIQAWDPANSRLISRLDWTYTPPTRPQIRTRFDPARLPA